MTIKKSMPPMTMDEVLLLVDTYYTIQTIENNAIKNETIAELSKTMRALPLFPELRKNPSFRSVDGMKMCLANVAWADPNANSKFGHGSIAQRKVLDYFSDKKTELHEYARSIVDVGKASFPIKPEFKDFIAGAILPSYHCYLESNDKTVKSILKETRAQQQTRCRVCGRDLSNTYGIKANSLMELHINVPLSNNTHRLIVSPSDLILLCPTCHKLAHSEPRAFETDTIQLSLKECL